MKTMRFTLHIISLIAVLSTLMVFSAGAQHTEGHSAANKHMNERPFHELVAGFEKPNRASWQKPEDVIALFRGLKNRKVLDLGCGTGYFSFRMADSGATVIAADVDSRFLAYVDSVKAARKISDKTLQTRLVQPNDAGLKTREVDMVLMVNTYHHIEERVAYFRKLKTGLKQNGFVTVVDYFKKELPMGPPVAMKLSADEVIRELKMAGFTQFKTDETTLPYQYIVFAM